MENEVLGFRGGMSNLHDLHVVEGERNTLAGKFLLGSSETMGDRG